MPVFKKAREYLTGKGAPNAPLRDGEVPDDVRTEARLRGWRPGETRRFWEHHLAAEASGKYDADALAEARRRLVPVGRVVVERRPKEPRPTLTPQELADVQRRDRLRTHRTRLIARRRELVEGIQAAEAYRAVLRDRRARPGEPAQGIEPIHREKLAIAELREVEDELARLDPEETPRA